MWAFYHEVCYKARAQGRYWREGCHWECLLNGPDSCRNCFEKGVIWQHLMLHNLQTHTHLSHVISGSSDFSSYVNGDSSIHCVAQGLLDRWSRSGGWPRGRTSKPFHPAEGTRLHFVNQFFWLILENGNWIKGGARHAAQSGVANVCLPSQTARHWAMISSGAFNCGYTHGWQKSTPLQGR